MKLLLLLMLLSCSAMANEIIQLTAQNTVTFRGEVSTESTAKYAAQLYDLVEKRGKEPYPIYLVLDSPGGDIEAGENFIQFVKVIPNIKTITIFAASMASAIVQALPGERLITENGTMMFHRARGQMSGQFETGELESRLAYYSSIVRAMETRNAKRMGIANLKLYKRMVKDELWHYGQSALSYSSADKMVDINCSKQLMEGKSQQTVQVFIFTVKVEYSECPLMRDPTLLSGQDAASVEAFKTLKTNEKLGHAL